MINRDGIIAIVALALSTVALAGMLVTDEYSHGARTEAIGYDALTRVSLTGVPAEQRANTMLAAADE